MSPLGTSKGRISRQRQVVDEAGAGECDYVATVGCDHYVVELNMECAEESGDGLGVGEDADGVGVPPGLAVGLFDRLFD